MIILTLDQKKKTIRLLTVLQSYLDLHLYDNHKRKDSIIKSSENCLNHESVSFRNKETKRHVFHLFSSTAFFYFKTETVFLLTRERKYKHAIHAALRMRMSLCTACACIFFFSVLVRLVFRQWKLCFTEKPRIHDTLRILTVVGTNKSFVSISFYAIREGGFIIDDKNALSIRMVSLNSKILRGYEFTLLFAQKQYQNKNINMSPVVFLLQVAIIILFRANGAIGCSSWRHARGGLPRTDFNSARGRSCYVPVVAQRPIHTFEWRKIGDWRH